MRTRGYGEPAKHNGTGFGMSFRRGASFLLLGLLFLMPRAGVPQASGTSRPNVVVFVADDLGWRDVGVYGNRFIRTPNLDSLARSGLRVKLAFGTSPQCSPSRISMLSG